MTATKTAKEIKTNSATIRILSDTSFEIDDSPKGEKDQDGFYTYGPYCVNDTANLDTVIAILDNPTWTEEQINAAVEELGRDEEQERREYLEDLRIEARMEGRRE